MSWIFRARRSLERFSRSGSAATRASSKRGLPESVESLYCSSRLNEAARHVPSPRRNRSLQGRLVSDTIRFKKEASGASRRLFYAVSEFRSGARSLKTQQRSVQMSRPRPAQPHAAAGTEAYPRRAYGHDLRAQAQGEKNAGISRQSFFTESLILAQDERWR